MSKGDVNNFHWSLWRSYFWTASLQPSSTKLISILKHWQLLLARFLPTGPAHVYFQVNSQGLAKCLFTIYILIFCLDYVLWYFKNGTHNNLVDPTEDQRWIRKKADTLGIILMPSKTFDSQVVECPDILKVEILNKTNSAGWSKSLEIPKLCIGQIGSYHMFVNKKMPTNFLNIKKPCNQLLDEKFIDTGSIYTKENDEYFCVKGVCGASLKHEHRWIFTSILNILDVLHTQIAHVQLERWELVLILFF